ncbi:nucleoside monophosphate kinase [Nodosilinea sp. LEGE 07298]|uniref:nucleoside monophosphate kinase n=1 Tax=Nodosilinea sp. LEGE 07298 TaxID=2777970 RepID=UPI00187FD8E0|nr:nucleoside monophosphate kinase [Nodosilinea sp. LEGE 07298]MBE9111942.1 nucleoside monophosphate kinase [Nodosilinea sp. LEGE 07298]
MKPAILTFSGPIASGKSTISNKLAQTLHWSRVSFGDYVRSVADARQISKTREVLQAIGTELVTSDVEGFCKAALQQVNWQHGQPLVIDGVRHIEVLETLQKLVAPMKLHLIFITIDDSIQASRLIERGSNELLALQALELDVTEQQVGTYLKNIADFVVNGSRSVEEAAQDITDWLQSQCLKN